MMNECPECGSENINKKEIDYIIMSNCRYCGKEWFEDMEVDE